MVRGLLVPVVAGLILVGVAGCAGAVSGNPEPAPPTGSPAAPAAATPTPSASPQPADPTATPEPVPVGTPTPEPESRAFPWIDLDGEEDGIALRFQNMGWRTDFNKKAVSLAEFQNLLPRDRIIPIDKPSFAAVADAPDYMRAREPVIALEIGGEARAYPLAMLMWHEIVNDVVGGLPVTVTFCPLCNSAVTFDRTVDGEVLTFGTSGNLRNSDLVMWDRQTESWWQQITGEALVGELVGTRLRLIPAAIVSWETFAAEYPHGEILLRERSPSGAYVRSYDDPPYAGYDDVENSPFAFTGEADGRLLPMARVVAIEADGVSVAYPFDFLRGTPVVNDRVGELHVVVLFDNGTLSPFLGGRGGEVASGSTTVFDRRLGERVLTFEASAEGVKDVETGSVWSRSGRAVSGPLEGSALSPVVHGNHFWFAWAVFRPEAEVRRGGGAAASS